MLMWLGTMSRMIPSPLRSRGVAEPVVPLGAPQLLAHLVVIQDVVAVGAPLAGLEGGGGVEMADAEGMQIARDRGRRHRIRSRRGVGFDTWLLGLA